MFCLTFVLFVFSFALATVSKQTPFDLDTSLPYFTSLNTNYEQNLFELWESYVNGYDHPLVLQLKKHDKFYHFDYMNEENIFINNTVETLSDDLFDEIRHEIPSIKTRADLIKFKQNAIYILVRNYELDSLCKSILNFLSRVPHPYFDFIIMNDKPFDPFFINQITKFIINSNNPTTKKWAERLITVKFGLIKAEIWDPLEHKEDYTTIPMSVIESRWEQQEEQGILYGGSRSYRNMCRFQSMNFYNHPSLYGYKYTMRMEPGVEYLCNFDPFGELREGVKYAFTLSLVEYPETIPSLFTTYLTYKRDEYYRNRELFEFINDGIGGYNLCHFWTNFEVISLDWVRSEEYNKFMEHFDKTAGFYMERWGDAPLRTLAVVELLTIDEVQWLDIGYLHPPFVSCPGDLKTRTERQCTCEPYDFENDILGISLVYMNEDGFDNDNEDDEEEEEENNDNFDFDRITINMHDYSCLKKWWRYGEGKSFL